MHPYFSFLLKRKMEGCTVLSVVLSLWWWTLALKKNMGGGRISLDLQWWQPLFGVCLSLPLQC